MELSDSGALMTVLAGILEDAVRALQRIEKKMEDQGKIFNEFTQKLEKIEKTINTSIMSLGQNELPSLEKNITQKIDDLGIQNFQQIEVSLDQIIMKLERSIQILSIQNLVSRIENLATLRSLPAKKPKKQVQPKEKVQKEVKVTEKSSPAEAKPVAQVKKQVKEKAEEEAEDSLIKPSSFFGSD